MPRIDSTVYNHIHLVVQKILTHHNLVRQADFNILTRYDLDNGLTEESNIPGEKITA